MTRALPPITSVPHGRAALGGEPLVFHCNYYNYFLQKTLLLDESLGMEQVIHDAAAASAYALLTGAAEAAGAVSPQARRRLAQDVFAELGFGLLDLEGCRGPGDRARVPLSHYGTALRLAAGAPFRNPQSYFDAGYVAAAAAFVEGVAADSLEGRIERCQALGAPVGVVRLAERSGGALPSSPGVGLHGAAPMPIAASNVDEPAILGALAGLDFAGNEEGLIPRFGVLLTRHFANFYDRVSFELLHRMEGSDLGEAAEALLTEAGLRCAFHTFGGIMTSAEWDAVVRPYCRTPQDWVHGMVAVVNVLGWGTWRVRELVPGERLVVRIHDDYEAAGYVPMYGPTSRPVSFLALGAVAGLMNLVYVGAIADRPPLDLTAYVQMFEARDRFTSKVLCSMANGDAYTEIVAER
ncbi:MAG: hypothetical protein IT378_19255 [Sandaracinaceae bacterium]|nr:hypothetical protein [Sandaracinaceae bacterium]